MAPEEYKQPTVVLPEVQSLCMKLMSDCVVFYCVWPPSLGCAGGGCWRRQHSVQQNTHCQERKAYGL